MCVPCSHGSSFFVFACQSRTTGGMISPAMRGKVRLGLHKDHHDPPSHISFKFSFASSALRLRPSVPASLPLLGVLRTCHPSSCSRELSHISRLDSFELSCGGHTPQQHHGYHAQEARGRGWLFGAGHSHRSLRRLRWYPLRVRSSLTSESFNESLGSHGATCSRADWPISADMIPVRLEVSWPCPTGVNFSRLAT